MAHDAAYWDDRYSTAGGDKHEHRLSGGPDPTVVEVAAALPPGRALDVAAGSGRHALWLAAHGWAVTAVDFSAVGLRRGARAESWPARADDDGPSGSDRARGLDRAPGATVRPVDWVVADVTHWAPPEGTAYDLILCAFFHLDADIYPRVRAWLAPGGRLVVVGHALRNLTDGVGGPSNPAYLHTEDQLRAAAHGLEIERLGEVIRPVGDGAAQQIDLALVARRPS